MFVLKGFFKQKECDYVFVTFGDWLSVTLRYAQGVSFNMSLKKFYGTGGAQANRKAEV